MTNKKIENESFEFRPAVNNSYPFDDIFLQIIMITKNKIIIIIIFLRVFYQSNKKGSGFKFLAQHFASLGF